MWIERHNKKSQFLQTVISLKSQVLLVRGARQVGKTSFILNALQNLKDNPQIRVNLASKGKTTIDGAEYFGRDYFGYDAEASQLLHNITLIFGDFKKVVNPIIVFIDEADRHPISLEAVQTLAGLSDKIKVIYTGSNLENISVKNAATGRKSYFDLYPVTFREFLKAYSKDEELKYLEQISLKEKKYSEMYHNELTKLFDVYFRLGGMPKVLDTFLEPAISSQSIPQLISDLVHTIEENVKIVLDEKYQLYEYEDVLRKLALLSMDTLKFSRLQVQHARRAEVKKLVNKTVGARVAHKIRLYESGTDLSKYMFFDCGVLNYLLNGSDLLNQKIADTHMAIQYETIVASELIVALVSRDDLFYWKSKRGAQVEFMLRTPSLIAIDVKSTRGDVKSLDSCAVYEKDLQYIVKVSKEMPTVNVGHVAKIANMDLSRKIPLITIPHYLSGRLLELM